MLVPDTPSQLIGEAWFVRLGSRVLDDVLYSVWQCIAQTRGTDMAGSKELMSKLAGLFGLSAACRMCTGLFKAWLCQIISLECACKTNMGNACCVTVCSESCIEGWVSCQLLFEL